MDRVIGHRARPAQSGLGDFVKFLRRPGEFKLLDDSQTQSWDR